jgi:hypothetical protein
MKNNKTYWVKKYAILLVCFYLLNDIIVQTEIVSKIIKESESIDSRDAAIKNLIYSGISILLNIVLAVIVYGDIKKIQIKMKYAVLLTVLYAPMGVCLFLLYVILSQANKSEHEFETPPSFY